MNVARRRKMLPNSKNETLEDEEDELEHDPKSANSKKDTVADSNKASATINTEQTKMISKNTTNNPSNHKRVRLKKRLIRLSLTDPYPTFWFAFESLRFYLLIKKQGLTMSNSITIAHEIGHTMGVEHDVSPDCITHGYTVMSPTVAQRFERHKI